jgi:hypothetical protein
VVTLGKNGKSRYLVPKDMNKDKWTVTTQPVLRGTSVTCVVKTIFIGSPEDHDKDATFVNVVDLWKTGDPKAFCAINATSDQHDRSIYQLKRPWKF